MSGFLTSFLYIILAICVMLFMITVHEFGHYTAGKLLKFKINEFSIGFGKVIFSRTKKNGEKFSLRIFPLGGFCAFEGEDDDKADNKDAFNSQPAWKRLIVLFMGAFFNFLSAIIFAIIFLMAFGYADRIQIKSFETPSNFSGTQEEWFMEDDIILAVNGKETNFVYDEYFTTLISDYDIGNEDTNNFTVTVKRNGKNVDLNIWKSWFDCESRIGEEGTNFSPIFSVDGLNYNYTVKYESGLYKFYNIDNPQLTYTTTDGFVTIGGTVFKVDTTAVSSPETDLSNVKLLYGKVGVITQTYKYGFFEVIGRSFIFCLQWAWKILIILWQLISGKLALSNMGGTVATVVTIAQITQTNIANLLLLIPIISINLAVFNLLPFPALDGARMLFVLIEMIRRKPINRKIEGMIHFVGLIILIVFIVFIDILHFVV